jgi:YesN/AraC family two-component response regulator
MPHHFIAVTVGADLCVRPALTNREEALGAFRNRPEAFDVVLTDMTMPNLTGIQLAEKLMAIRPDIPTIICTGFSERISENERATIGIKGFLLKPVVKSEMAKMVRKVLDAAKAALPALPNCPK